MTRYPRSASMPSRVPTDHLTGSSKANGGIRHESRSALAKARESCSSTGVFGRHRPDHHSTPKVAPAHMTRQTPKPAAIETMLRLGNTVVAINIPDSSNSALTMTPGHYIEPRPVHPWAQHLPVIAQQQQEYGGARQEQSGQRLHAGGDQPQRCSGDKHDRCRDHDHPGVGKVERFRVSESTVQRVLEPEYIPEGIAAGQRHRRRPDNGGVEQHDREHRTEARAVLARAGVRARRRRRNSPRLLVARAAQSPVIINAAAPIATTKAPSVVSARS